MKTYRVIAGGICLVLAALAFALGATKVVFTGTQVTIYPAAALGIAGLVLVWSGMRWSLSR